MARRKKKQPQETRLVFSDEAEEGGGTPIKTAPEAQPDAEMHKEYARFVERQAKAQPFVIDFLIVASWNPSSIPDGEPIYNTDIRSIEGDCPLLCPRAEPKFPAERLRGLEKDCKERLPSLYPQEQTILWVGRQAKMGTVCGWPECDCFETNPKPVWDKEAGELRYGKKLCKRYRQPAQNQRAILDEFESLGWPRRIDDPLRGGADIDVRQRFADAVRGLNAGNDDIRFELDGTSEGIIWKPCD